MGVAGAGAFTGALFLAYLGDFKRKGWSVLGGAFGFGVFLIAFAQATHYLVFDFSFRRRVYRGHVCGGNKYSATATCN